MEQVLKLDMSAGTARTLGDDEIVVSGKAARANVWAVGDVVPTEFAATGRQDLRVTGVYGNKAWLGTDYVISLATQRANTDDALVANALVTATCSPRACWPPSGRLGRRPEWTCCGLWSPTSGLRKAQQD